MKGKYFVHETAKEVGGVETSGKGNNISITKV